MFLGTVTGDIVSTIHHPFYDGKRLLIVDRENERGQPTGGYIVAVATVEAGVGDHVLVLDEGNGSRQVFGDSAGPVRSTVVGIVDAVELVC